MKNIYSVKQVNEYIKNMFAQDFMMNRIYVKGEVSNCKYHSTGHIYFSLKDESGTISCIMYAGQRSGLSFRMSEGMQVVVLGNISVYPKSGKYQLYANQIIHEGTGELSAKFEALKKELEEMGMFATMYKQEIPKFAKTIGIVTALTGAAVQDIIHIVQRRNPYIQLILYPALVQGEGAVQSIVNGITMMDDIVKPDVLIVGRGGGSIEELWAFNEPEVAHAIFNCSIPIISAVGHETDTTIADYVSDLRAPTPSAAAELAAYEYHIYMNTVIDFQQQLEKAILWKLTTTKQQLLQAELKLKLLQPEKKLQEQKNKLVQLEQLLQHIIEKKIQEQKHQLELQVMRLKILSPLEKLSQGYAYVSDQYGKQIRNVSDVTIQEPIEIVLESGMIEAVVTNVKKGELYGKS